MVCVCAAAYVLGRAQTFYRDLGNKKKIETNYRKRKFSVAGAVLLLRKER